MEPFNVIQGTAYPFGMHNCDTDVIISSEWLKVVDRTGLGKGVFAALRQTPGSVFDDPRYIGSPILIAGSNFGCGSSREHAAWALGDLGVRVVIAPSFSDIFAGNAFKNGILTIVLPESAVTRLLEVARTGEIRVNLLRMEVTAGADLSFPFTIDEFRRHCLIEGLDEIDLTLRKDRAISTYEMSCMSQRAWQYSGLPDFGNGKV